MHRRHLLLTLATLSFPTIARARQAYTISEEERLIAAIQDGGKIIYLIPASTVA